MRPNAIDANTNIAHAVRQATHPLTGAPLEFQGRVNFWNVRDHQMAETLEHLMAHVNRQVTQTKLVVWDHNSQLGDARATHMGRAGEWNGGQLVRERYGKEAVLVGFTTYT